MDLTTTFEELSDVSQQTAEAGSYAPSMSTSVVISQTQSDAPDGKDAIPCGTLGTQDVPAGSHVDSRSRTDTTEAEISRPIIRRYEVDAGIRIGGGAAGDVGADDIDRVLEVIEPPPYSTIDF